MERKAIPVWRRFLYVTLPLLLLALLVEGTLAFVDREMILVKGDDPQTVYRLYPNRVGIAAGPEYRVEVRTDELGLRFCGKAGPSRPDVLVLGDSFAEGWGVDCPDTFPERLAHSGISIRNGGVHGGSASFYVLRVRELVPLLRPRILVIQLFDNDLDDLDRFAPFVHLAEEGRVAAARPPALLFLPSGSLTRWIRERATFRIVKRAADLVRGRPAPIKYYRPGREPKGPVLTHAEALSRFGRLRQLTDPTTQYTGQFAFYIPGAPERPPWADRLRKMRIHLTQAIVEARYLADGLQVVLLYIPAKEVFAAGGIVPGASGRPGPLQLLLFQVAAEQKLLLVDGTAVLRQDAESLYFPGDAHLNSAGHARVAGAVLPLLRGLRRSSR